MRKLTQDDFEMSYTSINDYPRIISWVLSEPLVVQDARISVDVLQRQFTPDEPFHYIASIDASSVSVGSSDGFETDPYADSDMVLEQVDSFEEAIETIEWAIEDLKDEINDRY